jgi:hypothetical protein
MILNWRKKSNCLRWDEQRVDVRGMAIVPRRRACLNSRLRFVGPNYECTVTWPERGLVAREHGCRARSALADTGKQVVRAPRRTVLPYQRSRLAA